VVTFQGEGYNSLKVNLGDEDVKRRKDEFFDGAGANYWGGGGGDFPIWNWGWRAENNFRDGKISLDIT